MSGAEDASVWDIYPIGIILPWLTRDTVLPQSMQGKWRFYDELDGLYLVGTKDSAAIGHHTSPGDIAFSLNVTTGGQVNGNYYSWGHADHNTVEPTASGRDHTHSATVAVDRKQIAPASMPVRFIIRVDS